MSLKQTMNAVNVRMSFWIFFLCVVLISACNVQHEGRTLLHWAALNNQTDVVLRLLEEGAEINALSKSYETPLYLAVRSGSSEAALLLISREGVDLASCPDGKSLLHWAVINKDIDVAAELLRSGVRTGITDSSGRTALHYAAEANSPELVMLLLENGEPHDIPWPKAHWTDRLLGFFRPASKNFLEDHTAGEAAGE